MKLALSMLVFGVAFSLLAVEKLQEGVRYNFAFEGDSITQLGWPSYMTNYPRMAGFVGRFTNSATSGDYTTNFINQFTNDVYPMRPSGPTNAWAFERGGANDIGGSGAGPLVSSAVLIAAKSNYWALLRTNGFKVGVVTITERTQFKSVASLSNAWVEVNTFIVGASNLWDFCYRADLRFPDSSDTLYFSDGLHPTALASQMTGEEIATNLLPIQTFYSNTAAIFGDITVGRLRVGP